jgi:tRNA G37 N-methylase Trm5/tRNA(Phe) wybutosine-synthesizing methylase Tyw3
MFQPTTTATRGGGFSANENILLRQDKKRIVACVEATMSPDCLDMGTTVMVMQVSCKAPGCVPLETAIIIVFPKTGTELIDGLPQSNGGSYKTKVLKPMADVTDDDVLEALPPCFEGGRRTMEKLCTNARDVCIGQITQLFGDDDKESVRDREAMALYLQQCLQRYMQRGCVPLKEGEREEVEVTPSEPAPKTTLSATATVLPPEGNFVIKRRRDDDTDTNTTEAPDQPLTSLEAESPSLPTTQERRHYNDFQNAKAQCLGKRDKSFQGRIDASAVQVCGIINEKQDYFTTSSCAGRCFLYQGQGVKATNDFTRYRISHDLVREAQRYFDLTTIHTDPTGGGDPIRSIGQYDYRHDDDHAMETDSRNDTATTAASPVSTACSEKTTWLRYEPFILHVACRSLSAASKLMAAARPSFKNVGLTTWKQSRYLVAIWGDEGLEMPLKTPTGTALYPDHDSREWLAQLCNDRHERNWSKIQRFCQSLRDMPAGGGDDDQKEIDDYETMLPSDGIATQNMTKIPKSFDVIGDVAYLHSLPECADDPKAVGESIMKKNRSIKVVVARKSNLEGVERAPGADGLEIIAGADRYPLITTHTEYGIKCVVDLNHTFFTPRMGQERLRICQQVARGEDVLVCFGGVGMEAIQIAGRTEASSVVHVELNEVAVECARRGHRMLERNKAVKCAGAAERLQIIQGDVLEVVPSLPKSFDRILAPRPKEGKLDSDLGTGDGGEEFLKVLLPKLKDGGEVHWYDFVADWEFPACDRTKKLISKVCDNQELEMTVLHVARVGSVAMRQMRICLDFKIRKRSCNDAAPRRTTVTSAGQVQLPSRHQKAIQGALSDSNASISRLFDRQHAPGIRQAGCPCCDPDNPSALLENMMNM